MKLSHLYPLKRQACACVTLRLMGILGGMGIMGAMAQGVAAGPAVPSGRVAATPKPGPRSAGPHLLELRDGSPLHGNIEAIDSGKGSLRLRHAAASGALSLPMAQIARLSFGDQAHGEVKARASIRFRSGGWLAGEVTGMEGDSLQLQLEDGSRFKASRDEIEWIYFSKGPAPESYDGPSGLGGWSSNGSWTYRDGALCSAAYAPIQREFGVLPDMVEYQVQLSEGPAVPTLSIILRGVTIGLPHTKTPVTNQPDLAHPLPSQPRELKIALTGQKLRLAVTTRNGGRTEDADVSAILPKAKPGAPPAAYPAVKLRVLQNYVTGKLFAFINDRKAAEWTVTAAESGKNGGTFVLESAWTMNAGQSFSKIKVLPWDGVVPKDGEPETDAGQADRIFLQDGKVQVGRITSVSAGQIGLKSAEGETKIQRDNIALLRFAQGKASAPGAAVARVRLERRGEFEASIVSWREGSLLVQARFGAELALSPSLLDDVQFLPGAFVQPAVNDTLVFRDGDRLPGVLESTASNGKVSWRASAADGAVEIESAQIASVLLGERPGRPPANPPAVVRFRNGDWIGGKLLELDQKQARFETAQLGTLQIPRAKLQSLYFAISGQPAVFDASTEPELWQRPAGAFNRASQQIIQGGNGGTLVINGGGVTINGEQIVVEGQNNVQLNLGAGEGGAVVIQGGGNATPVQAKETVKGTAQETDKEPARSGWAYVDGTFSVVPPGANGQMARTGFSSPSSLNRLFDALPPRVEMSFDVTFSRTSSYCSARIFSEGGSPGYTLSMTAQSTTLRDTGLPQRKAVVFPADRDLSIGFNNDQTPVTITRRIRIFADRLNDTVTVFADGVRVASLKPKASGDVRKLGRGVTLVPSGTARSFSNVWVGPWSGRLPDEPAAAKPINATAPDKGLDVTKWLNLGPAPIERVVLANGDEAEGTINSATAEALKIESDIGPLTLLINRLSMVDFGVKAGARPAGFRLRLAGRGILTVSSYAIAKDVLTCQSEALGELKIPLAAVQEVAFTPAAAEEPLDKVAASKVREEK